MKRVRASAFQFKGKTENLRVIGEELNVSTVLWDNPRYAAFLDKSVWRTEEMEAALR